VAHSSQAGVEELLACYDGFRAVVRRAQACFPKESDAVMERVDEDGHVISFSILGGEPISER